MKKFLSLITLCMASLFAHNQEVHQHHHENFSEKGLSQKDLSQNETGNTELLPLQGDQFQTAFWKMVWVLAGLIALVILTVWMLRRLTNIRLQQSNRYSSIKILEKRNLSPKSILYVVEVEGRRILVSESHLEIRKLDTMPALTELEEQV